jgi:GT2 family glycosyltransferase
MNQIKLPEYMLSIIVCSRNKKLPKEFIENIIKTVGVDYEIIAIDNSENKHSIFSAYNAGFAQSKNPYLCFVHEDVIFHSSNWGTKVIAHLDDKKTGIIGVAGGDLVPRVPSSWATLISPGHNIIQTHKNENKLSEFILKPENFDQSKRSSITLDGVFMCMKRELMQEIHFDENLKGFHGYDYDITLQSTVAGYVNYVIYDIKLEHFSGGRTDIQYFRNLISIFKKWEKYLPIIGENITEVERLNIPRIEKKKLFQLTKKMVRKGFELAEIKSEMTYYAKIIDCKEAIQFLKIRVFLIRLFNCPKFILKSYRKKANLLK